MYITHSHIYCSLHFLFLDLDCNCCLDVVESAATAATAQAVMDHVSAEICPMMQGMEQTCRDAINDHGINVLETLVDATSADAVKCFVIYCYPTCGHMHSPFYIISHYNYYALQLCRFVWLLGCASSQSSSTNASR